MLSAELIDWTPYVEPAATQIARRPHVLTAAEWPPDYTSHYLWRMARLAEYRADPELLRAAKAYYARPENAKEFILHWCDTFDPRKKSERWMPFVLFQRQGEFLDFLTELIQDQESGLVEKARDMGLTWLCVAWSVWAWIFVPQIAIGWGSRKQELVDKIGDPDSIFEKMRLLIGRLPKEFMPENELAFMKCVNVRTGATITGEIGDNIGRGGRKSIYFKDESAHYIHPDLIEASLGDNTNVQIDISSVNGIGNVFERRRNAGTLWTPDRKIEPGKTRVFVVDWRDHPAKTDVWYNLRRTKAEAEGLLAKFKQEVDRDYAGSISGVIILPEWVNAAVDADKKLAHWRDDRGRPFDWLAGPWGSALDVADSDDGDKNALAMRKGIVLSEIEERGGARDVGVTTRWAINFVKQRGRQAMQYDSIGMGSGVKAEYNRLIDDEVLKREVVQLVPWNAGSSVRDPFFRIIPDDEKSEMNKDFFANFKAQAWWALKMRFYKTWRAVTEGVIYPIEELIVIDGQLTLLHQLKRELSQPVMTQNSRLLQQVDKKPDGSLSPNLADATVMAYFPNDPNSGTMSVGTHGT